MDHEGTHEDRAACRSVALGPRAVRQVGFGDLVHMGARDDPKRAVVGTTVIKVEPDRKHSAKKFDGRYGVRHPSFDGPWPKARQVVPSGERDVEVLVGRHSPIHLRRLVEEDAPHRASVADVLAHSRVVREATHLGVVEQVASSGSRKLSEVRLPEGDLVRIEERRDEGEAIAFEHPLQYGGVE